MRTARRRPDRRPTATRLGAALVFGTLAVGVAACSSSSASAPTTTGSGSAAATTACTKGASAPSVTATPVAGSGSDWTVTSFDGTAIRVHWFPLAGVSSATAPTVLMGPGWSLPGDTDTTGTGILGGLPIPDLWAAGYNVLTWDPRGFGRSGGAAEVDSPAYEAKDVSTLIDWVATRPGVELDGRGNPRLGMVGGSYGGGIQFVTAAADCRVDAIVPTIAWHSLGTSLYKSQTVKAGWAGILTNLTKSEHVAPQVTSSYASGKADGTISAADEAWFLARGPAPLLSHVRIPTLILQGTVDTLFTLQEGVANYEVLRAQGVPTAMQWFCGGHGICLTATGDETASEQAALAWLQRYVQRDRSAPSVPGFSFVDQDGTSWSAPAYPPPHGAPVTASGSGTLPLVATGGSGPVTSVPAGQTLSALAAPITPAPATNAVDVPVTFPAGTTHMVGAPALTLTYSGTAGPSSGGRPERVFAQLVDTASGTVLGNQVTPIPVTLDGASHTVRIPLEIVAYTAQASSRVELQLVATTVTYAPPALGGSIRFASIGLSLPAATGLTQVSTTATGQTATSTTTTAAG